MNYLNLWLADEPIYGGYCGIHGHYTTRYCEHCLDDEMDRHYDEERESNP